MSFVQITCQKESNYARRMLESANNMVTCFCWSFVNPKCVIAVQKRVFWNSWWKGCLEVMCLPFDRIITHYKLLPLTAVVVICSSRLLLQHGSFELLDFWFFFRPSFQKSSLGFCWAVRPFLVVIECLEAAQFWWVSPGLWIPVQKGCLQWLSERAQIAASPRIPPPFAFVLPKRLLATFHSNGCLHFSYCSFRYKANSATIPSTSPRASL